MHCFDSCSISWLACTCCQHLLWFLDPNLSWKMQAALSECNLFSSSEICIIISETIMQTCILYVIYSASLPQMKLDCLNIVNRTSNSSKRVETSWCTWVQKITSDNKQTQMCFKNCISISSYNHSLHLSVQPWRNAESNIWKIKYASHVLLRPINT